MSGHSKWATTKHKKAVVDAKRGKLFAKLIKNVEVAARTGGGDPAGNPTLFDAIQKAKKSSVPNDNIDRAVRRGSGLELPAPPVVDAVEVGDGEVVLARKVPVEGGLGDSGRGDDRVDPDTAHAVGVEEAKGGIENALPRLTPGRG